MLELLNFKNKLSCLALNIASNLLYKKYGVNCSLDECYAKQANAILWVLRSGCTLTDSDVCKIKDFITNLEKIGYSCNPITNCISTKGCNLNYTDNEIPKECPTITYTIQ